jgi:ribosomal protein S12 methylthiotransferase
MENKKIKASFVSLGCFKNLVDTEVLGGLLEKHNIQVVSEYEETDWIIINTCGFIREAKEESIAEILNSLEKKEIGEIKNVAVFGCLTQRYYKDLKEQFKSANILWGVNDLEELAEFISKNEKTEYEDSKPFLYNETHKRIITTAPNTTFIKISEGCNMKCSFCAIPEIRGPYRSRSIESIIKEAEDYKNMGFREINLISQNSTYFGKDSRDKSLLPELLKEISRLGFWGVRVLYLMPEEVTDEMIEAFSYPSILPYFDLPFQHVSPSVLKRMNRSGDSKRNLGLLDKIRHKHPDAVIRSSFIVGFPGESFQDFEILTQFAKDSGIERIGVFSYSEEENTEAFKYKNAIKPEVIEERKEILMDISDENMLKYNQKLIGSYHSFLPLGPWEGGSTIGRIWSQGPETDGLTQVKDPFKDDYQLFKIHIKDFQNEILEGERE